MKFLILISLLAFSAASFAKSVANAERELLCKAVDEQLVMQSADMALDVKKCLKNKTVKSRVVSNGTRVVEGVLEFNAPFRPSFTSNCELAYKGMPNLKNIVNGIEEGVACN
jgi:hypothetical protein